MAFKCCGKSNLEMMETKMPVLCTVLDSARAHTDDAR